MLLGTLMQYRSHNATGRGILLLVLPVKMEAMEASLGSITRTTTLSRRGNVRECSTTRFCRSSLNFERVRNKSVTVFDTSLNLRRVLKRFVLRLISCICRITRLRVTKRLRTLSPSAINTRIMAKKENRRRKQRRREM